MSFCWEFAFSLSHLESYLADGGDPNHVLTKEEVDQWSLFEAWGGRNQDWRFAFPIPFSKLGEDWNLLMMSVYYREDECTLKLLERGADPMMFESGALRVASHINSSSAVVQCLLAQSEVS